ncbi:nitrate ABC transporter substrate-binding protein [Sorangium cellulosum]|uniref:Nitrate ABC transporter substrate-binding protein n=1 Tax=Sorangium cellulosum TaxID=56 RepID=A0A150P733_SORCE|nr:nitrate ABC transporter substrate-binding protein [Sorangium cellulosum]
MKNLLVAIAAVSLVLISIFERRAPDEKPTVIRLGVATAGAGNPPVYGGSSSATAQINGWIEEEFKADGIRVEWRFFKGAGPGVNEALASGQLDFAFQGDLPAIVGRASGVKTKLLLASGVRAHLYAAVPAGSALQSIDDLRGKRVAVYKGTNLQLAVDRALEAHGLTERDLKVVNLDFAASQAALASKDIDAAFGGFELLTLRDKGIANIIYSSKERSPALTRNAHVLVTKEFEEKYPAIVGRVVKTLVESARWTSDEENRDEVFALWARTGIPYATWKESFDGEPMKLRNSPLFDGFLTHRYKQAVADAQRFKLIRRGVDVDAWIDKSYLDAAIRSLHLEGYWPSYDSEGNPE